MRAESDVFPDATSSSPTSFATPDLPRTFDFSDPSSSSLLKCCPTAWIFPEGGVPLSSSPPNCSDSSPLSATSDFSEGNGDESSSSTSRSSSTSCEYGDFNDSGTGHHYTSPSSNEFGKRLHDLLLVVARESSSVVAGGPSQVFGRAVTLLFSSPSPPPAEEKSHSQHGAKVAIATSRSLETNHISIEPRFRPSPFTQNKSFSFSSTSSLTSISDDSSQASSHSDLQTPVYPPPRRRVSRQASQENTGHRSTRPPLLQQRYTSFPKLINPPAQYRVIKRPQSFLADQLRNAAGEPVNKRLKTQVDSDNVQSRQRAYASRSASLRRAATLRSDTTGKTPTMTYPCVPTVPATPQVDSATAFRRKREGYCFPERLPQGVPIIAPPSNHVARFPLSAETIAKIRLGKYLAREGMGRVRDGLPTGICQDDGMDDCLISALPHEQDNSDSDEENGNEGEREKERIGHAQCRNRAKECNMASRREWEMMLDLGEDFRKEVLIWILEVLPDLHDDGSTTSSASSSRHSSFTSSSSRNSYVSSNLFDQLISSPETRFHAAWMFLRYFFLTMSPESAIWLDPANGSTSVIAIKKKRCLEDIGRMPIIWDIAVGCLALSVKVSF